VYSLEERAMEIVSDPDRLSAHWLNEVLQGSDWAPGGKVVGLRWKTIGSGKMGDNLRLELEYDHSGATPATLVAKLPAADQTARSMAAYTGAYRKEVMFYRELAAIAAIDTPKVYCALVAPDASDFVIVMEDLAPALAGDQLLGESVLRARRALQEAAQLHSAFHGRAQLLQADYITHNDPDSAAFGEQLLQQNWGGFVDRFGHGLCAGSLAFGEAYVAAHAAWASRFDGVRTLIHGDFRSENLLFNDSGRTTTVDWQTLSESSGLADVAYFLGGSLEAELRRSHEAALVEHYRQCLVANGVDLSAADCWRQYREFAMHGIMITVLGAMFSAPDPRGERMFLTMAQRHLQQCVDLQAAEFLP
jgi:aminoglycoside phosphotransferase (APT) family kinase protein